MVEGNEFSVSVQDALLESFRKHADRISIDDDDMVLSYLELDFQSASLAELILERTGDAYSRVALAFGQNAKYLVALVGVLRSGKAYVPLDPRRGAE